MKDELILLQTLSNFTSVMTEGGYSFLVSDMHMLLTLFFVPYLSSTLTLSLKYDALTLMFTDQTLLDHLANSIDIWS